MLGKAAHAPEWCSSRAMSAPSERTMNEKIEALTVL